MIIRTINIYNQQKQSLPISLQHKVRGLCFVFMLFALFANFGETKAIAQDTATSVPKTAATELKNPHSPRKAMIYSLVLPGLGQAYNRKYWKMPIVYAGFGAMIYFIHTNSKYYNELKDAYEYVAVTMKTVHPPTPPEYFPYPDPPNDWAKPKQGQTYTEAQLLEGRDFYRRNLEVSYIFTGVLYLLTTVDAVVDAHFFDYNISDDLTLQVNPWIPALGTNTASGISGGVNLTLRF